MCCGESLTGENRSVTATRPPVLNRLPRGGPHPQRPHHLPGASTGVQGPWGAAHHLPSAPSPRGRDDLRIGPYLPRPGAHVSWGPLGDSRMPTTDPTKGWTQLGEDDKALCHWPLNLPTGDGVCLTCPLSSQRDSGCKRTAKHLFILPPSKYWAPHRSSRSLGLLERSAPMGAPSPSV